MKKKQDDTRNTRDRILDAAADEFARYGLAGARVDRMAARAGVNKAMIYYHFSSKEALYQSIIDGQLARVADSVSDVIDSEVELEKALRIASETYHAVFAAERRFGAILLHELADGGERLKRSLQRLVFQRGVPQRVEKLIRAGIRRGRLRRVDGRQVLISFVGMNLFYLLMAPTAATIWEIKDEDKFRDQRPAHIVDLFMHGIEKR
jgi:TetR/AcrR family transcriptional regulator